MNDLQNDILEKETAEEYVAQFTPEICDLFYEAYGKKLETMPREFLHPSMTKEEFLEGLYELKNPKSQKLILMRLVIGADAPMTQEQVAEVFQITKERVKLIENMFLRRIHRQRRKRELLDSLSASADKGKR